MKKFFQTNAAIEKKKVLPSVRMTFFYSIVALATFFFILRPASSQAAHVYFGVHDQRVGAGQEFPVGFFVDTEQEKINAIEGTIIYDAHFLILKEVRDANSILNFWVEHPVVDSGCVGSCRVHFSGIAPGGFDGTRGLLLTLVFVAQTPGTSTVNIGDFRVLAHDGKGTEVAVRTGPITITADATIPIVPSGIAEDHEPPDIFVPTVTRDQNIFDGKWFVVFATQDKGSGIAQYEMVETPRAVTGEERDLRWRTVQSPAVLEDQSLGSYITIRAIDGVGNSRNASLPPAHPSRLSTQLPAWGIVIALLFVVLFVGRLVWRNIRQWRARR